MQFLLRISFCMALCCLFIVPANGQTRKKKAGTILLLTGGADPGVPSIARIRDLRDSLRRLGYHTVISDTSPDQARIAFRNLKTRQTSMGLQGGRLVIMGIGSGGPLAARIVQRLAVDEQPDDLLLVAPSFLDLNMPGTVIPAFMPPLQPAARLLLILSPSEPQPLTRASGEYAKTWKGYDGQAGVRLLKDSAYTDLSAILDPLRTSPPAVIAPADNPAAIPVPGWAKKRHEEKIDLVTHKKFDLILIGNSITNNFEKPEYQPVWRQFFAPRNALNLGFSAYRTENILWNIANGELDGQSPKVAILEIGTNNVDEKNYPTRHTAGQLAGGIGAIVRAMREKMPDTKIIILRCFPGCYGGPDPTSHRAILERASDLVSGLADGKNIFYCDVNHVFLHLDGSIDHDMMPDWLHPSPAGARAWAQAMEPLLSRLMGDPSLDREIPSNTAIVPVTKLEEDSYNWWDRHAEVMRIKDSINPEIVLIGNSITHFWGGLPQLRYADGRIRQPNGPQSWTSLFGGRRVLNLGFGWDRTQNVLWRLDNGELNGLHPRLVIIDIGTNNTSATEHARMNTAAEIVEGIRAVCSRVRSKLPGAAIVLMAVFPREKDPQDPRRVLIDQVNALLTVFAKEEKINLVNIGPQLLAPDGSILPGMTSDLTHPTDKGYQVWADAIRPFVNAP